MTWLHDIVLGIVQGLTEFLPVSSSGHLVVVPALFGWREPSLTFDLVLHLGTLIAQRLDRTLRGLDMAGEARLLARAGEERGLRRGDAEEADLDPAIVAGRRGSGRP